MIADWKKKLERHRIAKDVAAEKLRQSRTEFVSAEDELLNAIEAQAVIQTVALAVQQEAHDRIASVVSKCLEFVFEEPYEFRIEFDRKRGRTEANLVFVRGDLKLTDPVNEAGGGVIDVAAFALRLACLVLERPQKRRLLVLDEPFSKIRGERNRRRMRTLVEKLADEFGVQFVLNIDQNAYPEFLLGKVVEVV